MVVIALIATWKETHLRHEFVSLQDPVKPPDRLVKTRSDEGDQPGIIKMEIIFKISRDHRQQGTRDRIDLVVT